MKSLKGAAMSSSPSNTTSTPVRIGGIHAALGSTVPFSEAIRKAVPGAQVVNFLNEEMLQYVNRNGGVDPAVMRMFAKQVFHAEEAKVDVLVIACNIFAARIDDIRPFVSVPLLTVDRDMQEKAASIGGRIGVMATNTSSMPACCAGIRRAAAETGVPVPDFEDGTVVEAAEYLVMGDTETFDRLLTQRALELTANGCSAIVLSQVTMARAKSALEKAGIRIPILTSPEECARHVAAIVNRH